MKILVASDGSKNSMRALKYAVALVGQLNAKTSSLTVISVHDDAGLRHAKAFVGKDAVADYLRELSDKELKPAVKFLKDSGIKHDMVIRTGHVAEEIVKEASSSKYDMIVLGSKGRTSLADLLVGSVAQRVMSTAKQPVLLVK